jgi:hypothetical protein
VFLNGVRELFQDKVIVWNLHVVADQGLLKTFSRIERDLKPF